MSIKLPIGSRRRDQ